MSGEHSSDVGGLLKEKEEKNKQKKYNIINHELIVLWRDSRVKAATPIPFPARPGDRHGG